MACKKVSRGNRSKRGNVTLIFALSGVAAAAVVGGGVEITRVVDGKAKLQAALDAGALAAAGMPDGSGNGARLQVGKNTVDANLVMDSDAIQGNVVVTPDFSLADRITLSGELKLNSILGKSIFGAYHTINASSTAQKATAGSPAIPGTTPTPVCPAQPVATDAPAQVVPPGGTTTTTTTTPSPAANGCVWAVGQGNVNGAITFNSGNQINAPTCRMHVHSTDNDSVFHNWGNDITIDALYSKGRINCNKPCTANFESFANSKVINDPFASGLPQLTAGACMPVVNGGNYDGAASLTPGTYCGNMNFNANGATVNLAPGVYHIRGDWNLNGATVNAPGVTLYFESNTNFQLNGNTRLNLSAPTSGPTAGLAMYEKYGLGNGTRPIDARGGMNITGVIYFPTKQLNFNSGNNVTSVALQIVGRVIHFNDSDFNLAPYTGPLPPGFVLPGQTTTTTTTTLPGGAPVSTGSGLLNNGSFEQPVIPIGTWKHRTIAEGVPGWTTTRKFELQSSLFAIGSNANQQLFGGYGTDGVQYAQIEKDLSQTVTLPAGKTYRFEFDYAHGENGTSQDNRFFVTWGNTQLADVQPIQTATSGLVKWMRMAIPVVGTGNSVSFTFNAPLDAEYGRGAFLDRVRITEDNTLTAPPAGCPGSLPALPATPATPAVAPTPLRIIR